MSTRKASITALLGSSVAATLIDPVRILGAALMLRRMRRDHPELFDPSAAGAAVDAALADYRKEYR